MLIVESQSLDVYRNLAIEEYLMEHSTEPVLMLWRSDCAVVVGKNQNPWRECRLDLMRDEGVPLARRISGGGTVYHDAGNLNYCIIVDRVEYREELAYEVVIQALKTLGVRAEKTGKSNLSVDGRKFSGNAFCFRKGRALHHGTLLLDTNLERLAHYLGPLFDSIETRAISSVPATVTNLELNTNAIGSALKERFQALYPHGGEVRRLSDSDIDSLLLSTFLKKQHSDSWRYSATPKFTLYFGDQWVAVEKGLVVAASDQWIRSLLNINFSRVAFSLPCGID